MDTNLYPGNEQMLSTPIPNPPDLNDSDWSTISSSRKQMNGSMASRTSRQSSFSSLPSPALQNLPFVLNGPADNDPLTINQPLDNQERSRGLLQWPKKLRFNHFQGGRN